MFASKETEYKTPTRIEDLRKKEEEKLARAKNERDLIVQTLDSLPANSPVPESVYAHGYCASMSINFEGPGLVPLLLQLYPPLPLVDVRGGCQSQKPVKYLRDQELASNQLPLHPVLYKVETPGKKFGVACPPSHTICWWTSFPWGDAQIAVKGAACFEAQPDGEKFEPDSHTYMTGSTTFFARSLAEPFVQPAPLVAWEGRWERYIEGLSGGQARFVNGIRHQVRSGCQPLGMADLPEPHYVSPGSAVAIGEGEDMLEKLEALRRKEVNRMEHPFDHIGDFWRHFDREQAAAMLAFANSQAACLQQCRQDQEAAEESVRQAVLELFAGVSSVAESTRMPRHVEHWLRKKTGLDVKLAGLYFSGSKVTAWTRFHARDRGLTLDIPMVAGGRRLLIQDIPVEYR